MDGSKKWAEVVLMPLVIAIVGISGTYLITNEQREAAEIQAATDRQVKILDVFANRITSTKIEEKLLAAQMLLAMDSDLALKVMTTMDMSKEETIVREAVSRVTSHAIRLKLAENKKGDAYHAAILEGHWQLRRQGRGIEDKKTAWLEFRVNETGLTVDGDDWKGEVTFDGKHGYYVWKFINPETGLYDEKKSGRTDFYLDNTGILLGKVKEGGTDTGVNWTYWAVRDPGEIPAKK